LRNGDKKTGSTLAGLDEIFGADAPGLVMVVAGMGYDLAVAEKNRIANELRYLEDRLRTANQMKSLAAEATQRLRFVTGAIKEKSRFPDKEVILDTLNKIGAGVAAETEEGAASESATRAYLAMDAYLEAAPLVPQIAALDLVDARLQHLQSIRASQIAARQREILLSRGAETLAIYHSGGIKPQEIAEIAYQVAQLGLLGVIAGVIN
jgi:hypothetical protein